MRKFLLTWYGITDLRASLGFENTDGPIVAALAAEAYSDIVILGYTRADDISPPGKGMQKSFTQELEAIRGAGQQKDWQASGAFVSRYANTSIAHDYFINWLKAKLEHAGSDAQICFNSEKLRELNDTEGIFACATRALDFVEQQAGEKLVTLYLSPGTPVMAFVWAFAALEHPGLKKRLIASPVIGKSPEAIALPAEFLERNGVQQMAAGDAVNRFDVLFHLFGEQRMPSLLGIRQFESKRHVFVNSKDYPAVCMRPFIGNAAFSELPVDPWDARAVREQIIRYAAKLPADARIGMNLTGGTKLMFTGALAAARALGATPFYFDSRNRRMTLVDSLRSTLIRPIDLVKTFLLLHGDGLKLSTQAAVGWGADRRLLTDTLWKYRAKMAGRYKDICAISDEQERRRKNNASPAPFKIQCDDLVFEWHPNNEASVRGGGLNLKFKNWPDFAKYLSGCWFEEYVYSLFKPYADAGIIKDLRINVKLQLDQASVVQKTYGGVEYNELDVVFTDGYSLYIVECKAGGVKQDHIMKLQNLVRFYGGVEGRGILACCFKPESRPIQKKIQDAKLMLWSGLSLPEQLKELMERISVRAKADRELV